MFRYSIEISENDLDDYSASEPQEVSSGETGTVVEFESIKEEVIYSDIIEFLKVDFAWYVELNRYIGIELRINGKELDYSSILMEREEKQYAYGEYSFEVVFCRWEKRLHQEYSKYYYLNGAGVEKYKENTTLNNSTPEEARVLTIEETEWFLEAASHYRYFNEFSFALETGMRIGEIIGLKWSDIDFLNRTIYVN